MSNNKSNNKMNNLPSTSNVTPKSETDLEMTLEMITLDDVPLPDESDNNEEKSSKKEHNSRAKKSGKSNNKKKKSSLFKKGMYIYITLLTLVAVTLLILLWGKLDRYQKNYDSEQANASYKKELKHAPQVFFENYMANITSEEWITYWKNNQEYVLDTDETIKTFVDENLTNVDYTLYKSPAYTSDIPKYLIAYNDKVLASFTLTGKDNDWAIDNVSISLSGNKAATIEAPSYCTILCNGKELDDSFIISSASYNKVAGYEDQLINAPIYNTYEVTNLIADPEFEITANVSIDKDKNNRVYKLYDSSDNNTYKQQADSFIKSLLYYYSMGKSSLSENAASAASHVAANSNASKTIYSSKDGLSWVSPTNANYTTETSEVFELSDNCLFVDVYYQNTNAATEEERNTVETYRVFFLDLGNGFKIYSFSNV